MNFFIKLYDWLVLFFSSLKSLILGFFRPIEAKLFYLFFLLLNIASWLFAYFIFSNLTQDRLILHYNVDIGIDLIGDRYDVFIIPLIGLLMIVFNKIFLLFFFKKRPLDFKFVFYFSSFFLSITEIFLFLSLWVVYLINFK